MSLREHLKDENYVLKQAPISAIGLLVTGLALGAGAASWYFHDRISEADRRASTAVERAERLVADAERERDRYKVAAGLTEPASRALLALTNAELKTRARRSAVAIRTLYEEYRPVQADLQARLERKELTERQYWQLRNVAAQRVSDRFDNEARTEALLVSNELRSRLSAQALEHILTFFFVPDMQAVIWNTVSRGQHYDPFLLRNFAQGIEDMCSVLPD